MPKHDELGNLHVKAAHTSDSSSVAAAADRRLAAVRLLPADDGAADENMWRCFGSTPMCQLCWWFSAVLQPYRILC